jgi:preprotein translocase subunit SecG
MEQIIVVFHVLAALAIIGLIMLQQGKGADMGASFGSGSSQTLFGSSGGGNALTKATSLLVVVFFATSFGLAIVAKNLSTVGVDIDIPVPAVVETPAKTFVSDVPVVGEPEQESGELQQGNGLDVPSVEADAGGSDVTDGADVPGI